MSDLKSNTAGTQAVDRRTLHDLLASERRRHVLDCLCEHGRTTLPDLADVVAEREHDDPLPQVPGDAVLTTYLSLYHTHVPKLVDAGVASYDQDRDVVALTDALDDDSVDAVDSLDAVGAD